MRRQRRPTTAPRGATRRSSGIRLSPIKEVEIAAARLPGTVSLAQGIPSFDTPEIIKAVVAEKLAQGEAARYSLAPGLPELREAVAESLRQEGMRYDPDGEILITAGAIEAIAATLLALTDPGDEVIVPSPCYASYQQVIRMAGCVPRFVPLDEERNFDLDVEAIAARITPRTAAIFYCNPNNPTGTIYSPAQSLRMLELAERHGLRIITDEVYKDFLYTDAPYFTPAQEEAYRERVVRVFSFSKAYAMTGWRVGYLHSARSVVDEILKVHDSLVTCAPVISQHAALAALEVGGEAVAEFYGAYRRRRDLMLHHLDRLSHIFDYQKPNGAYFVFPRVKDPVPLSHDSRALALDLLQRGGVALVPGIAFGPTGESHLRLSFGRDEADIEEAFLRMGRYFAGQAARPAAGGGSAYAPTPQAPAFDGAREHRRWSLRGVARRGVTAYLSLLARGYLWRRRPKVVAIAGNRGKTVFKRTVSGMLARRYHVRAGPRSYNTEIGLPLAVLGLEINPRDWRQVAATLARATARAWFDRAPLDWLVVELGVRRPGDMAALLRTVAPDWAVVTPLALENELEPAELAVMAGELGLLRLHVAPERWLACEGGPPGESTEGLMAAPPIGRARLRHGSEGHLFQGSAGAYVLGRELVGESALLAAQAAILLGERLGIAAETIHAYVQDISQAGRAAAPRAAAAPPRRG